MERIVRRAVMSEDDGRTDEGCGVWRYFDREREKMAGQGNMNDGDDARRMVARRGAEEAEVLEKVR